MSTKSLVAAAAVVASAVALVPAEASAKTKVDVYLGLGLPVYPVYEEPSYVYVPAPRVRRYSYERVYEDDYDYERMSCRHGARIVRGAGFRSVDAYDCRGSTFGYTAWRHGEMFKVRVNSRGTIVAVVGLD
jgi:hypothetical protein